MEKQEMMEEKFEEPKTGGPEKRAEDGEIEEVPEEYVLELEEKTGMKFKDKISGVRKKDLMIEDADFNPEGKYGSYGAFDYAEREVAIDSGRIRGSEYSEEEVIKHELLHILERDELGSEPAHAHIMHATFSARDRASRLHIAANVIDEKIQEFLFGQVHELYLGKDPKQLRETIERIEAALKGKSEKWESLSENRQGALTIIAMDLGDIKTAYFAETFSAICPQAVADFEKKMRQVLPFREYLVKTMVYPFEEELEAAAAALAEKAGSPEKIAEMADLCASRGDHDLADKVRRVKI